MVPIFSISRLWVIVAFSKISASVAKHKGGVHFQVVTTYQWALPQRFLSVAVFQRNESTCSLCRRAPVLLVLIISATCRRMCGIYYFVHVLANNEREWYVFSAVQDTLDTWRHELGRQGQGQQGQGQLQGHFSFNKLCMIICVVCEPYRLKIYTS